MPDRVGQFFQDQPRRTFLNDIVSSQLDADRFDYLLRDNLHTGSRYGDFDLGWLLHALTTDQSGSRLAVTAKGISAVEAYLQSRYHMYRNVYFHKVVRAAEGMLKLALQRAGRLAAQDRLPWPAREDGVSKLLLGRRLSIDEFTQLDDVSLLHCLKLWIDADDVVLSRLCKGLLFRGLFKTIDLTAIDDPDRLARLIESARAAVRAAGGDPTGDIFYDEPSDAPYEIYDGQSSTHDIFIRDNTGNLGSFASRSPLPQALGRQLMFRRLHVAAAYRNAVESALRQ